MRIAQVAPLFESVPPKLYGGTERVVSYLTEELVNQGHDVTLYASGDSQTRAKLVSTCNRSLRLAHQNLDHLIFHYLLLEQLMEEIDDFDLIHFHIDYLHFPFSRENRLVHLTTLHGRMDLPGLYPLYEKFYDMPVVSISKSQRMPLSWINWIDTVYHGLPDTLYKPREETGQYLAFLGRISPEKRVDRAIEIAKKTGIPLKIAAKIDEADEVYFKENIAGLLEDPLIEFIGEITEEEKNDFLGNALALVFPIDWPEPFGLVMIEALACGTPVVAYRNGSVNEILDHGTNGYIVHSIEEAVDAVNHIHNIDRKNCRKTFEERFTAKIMASNYLRLYEKINKYHITQKVY